MWRQPRDVHVGTAALGCPVERSSTVFPRHSASPESLVISNDRVFHRGGGISVLTAVERQPLKAARKHSGSLHSSATQSLLIFSPPHFSSFIFLHTSVVCPLFESIKVVTARQLHVTVLAFSCLITTQCSIVSAVAGGASLRIGGGGGV
jgi:hypothetical protein